MKWIVGLSMMAVLMGIVAIATIPAATISIDNAILKFLPPETQGVAFIDVAGLKNAPLVEEALKAKAIDFPRDLKDFMTATGFDPLKDVDRITVGKVGARDGLVIVQGRIDRFKVEQFLKDKGKQPEVYLGQTVYHDRDGAFALLDNLALLGQGDSVKKAIDQMQIPGALPLRSDLVAAIQTIEAGNQIWAVGDFTVKDLATVGIRGPAPALEMLKTLKNGTYQMRVDADIHARAIGNFADAKSVQDITDMARGVLAVAKLQVAKQQPDFLRVLDGIQIANSGTTITVRIEQSGETLKKLKNLRPVAALGQ